MARPQKRTVDYFPHFVNHGKTLLILQNELGNDGYAFWFKLLSLLCKTDGQVYDYNNPASWRLLLAETHVSEDIANRALRLLAEIDAIDVELYQSKVIWVQHLIDNLADVYRRRQNGSMPKRPVIVNNNAVNVSNMNPPFPPIPPLYPPNKTKQNKTRQDKTTRAVELPDFIDKGLWNDFLEMRKKIRKPATDKAQELIIKKLGQFNASGTDPNEILKQSIVNSWQDVFPLKGGQNGAYKGTAKGTRLPAKYTEPPYDPELEALARAEDAEGNSG